MLSSELSFILFSRSLLKLSHLSPNIAELKYTPVMKLDKP